MSTLYTVIVPMYNEEEVIAESYKRLTQVMSTVDGDYELLFVNDGSRDKTMEIMRAVQSNDAHVRIVDFARNFGHQVAVTAGMEHARGDAVVIIDADLQDPPAVILEMIEKWKQGYEVVYGKRLERQGETFFKKFTAKMYYRILGFLSDHQIPEDTGDFRLIDRKVVDTMNAMKEHNRFLRGMVAWVGFRQTPVEYLREERWAGVTKYPLKKMIKLAIDGITAFSYKPLKLATVMGYTLVFGSLAYFLVLCILAICGVAIAVWQWPFAGIVLINGFTMIMLGIMGAYLGRIFEESKNRPIYIVREVIQTDKEAD